ASAVGRLCVNVFGLERAEGVALAHHLGRALQLTNIMRDLDEDAALGRLYLPREALRDAGIESSDPAAVLDHSRLATAVAPVLERARTHFREADAVMQRSPKRLVRTPRPLGEAYHILLRKLTARTRLGGAAREGEHRQAAAAVDRGALRFAVSRAGQIHVVGAGLAGLSAAVRLAAAGHRVIIHEASNQAGGRCRSYHDAALGMTIDNGNHLVLSGHRATLDYLHTIRTRAPLGRPPA